MGLTHDRPWYLPCWPDNWPTHIILAAQLRALRYIEHEPARLLLVLTGLKICWCHIAVPECVTVKRRGLPNCGERKSMKSSHLSIRFAVVTHSCATAPTRAEEHSTLSCKGPSLLHAVPIIIISLFKAQAAPMPPPIWTGPTSLRLQQPCQFDLAPTQYSGL